MITADQEIMAAVNQPGKIGILATCDGDGQPNMGYYGSTRILPSGDFAVTLTKCRTLRNVEDNPYASFMVLSGAPVGPATKGWRLYLKRKDIQREGELMDSMRKVIAAHAGQKTADAMEAVVLFDMTEIRTLIDQNG